MNHVQDLNWHNLNKVCISLQKNNTCRDIFNPLLVEEFNCLTQTFFVEVNTLKSDILIPDVSLSHSEKCISYLLDQVSKEQIVKLFIRRCKHALLKASTAPMQTSKKKLNSGAVNI